MKPTRVLSAPRSLLLAVVALLALALLPLVSPASAQQSNDTPGAPIGLVLALGNGGLIAGWNPPENDDGAEITAYEVQYRVTTDGISEDPNSGWVDAGHGGTGTDTEITGLTNGVGYDVRVRASNGEGDGQWSATASATPHEDVIWSAILTADVSKNNDFGCYRVFFSSEAEFDECSVALTEDEFEFAGSTYRWTQLLDGADPYVIGQSDRAGLSDSTPVPPESPLRKGKMQFGDITLSLDNPAHVGWYTDRQYGDGFNVFHPSAQGRQNWVEGERVPMSLQAKILKVTDDGTDNNNQAGVAFLVKQGVRSDGSGGSLVGANSLTISEGLPIAYFVKLKAQPSANVTVAPANSSSAIWVNTGYGGPLTFTPDNWSRVQLVQVFTSPGAADDEGARNITHTVSSDDSGYNGLTPSFTLDIVGLSSECTASAAPALTVDDSNRSMAISPSAASCGSTPIVGYDTAVKKDDGPWIFRANTRWAVPASATYSVRPVVNTYEVFSGSTYMVKTRGLTYDKGVSPWSPVSTITVTGVQVPVTAEEVQDPPGEGSSNQSGNQGPGGL